MTMRCALACVVAVVAGCGHDHQDCDVFNPGNCACYEGTSGPACPQMTVGVTFRCTADEGWPNADECVCFAYGCAMGDGTCLCDVTDGTTPTTTSCPSSPLCCLRPDDNGLGDGGSCECFYDDAPAQCPSGTTPVSSCAPDWVLGLTAPAGTVTVASCNPVENPGGGGGGGGGGSNCKHSGESCSSSSECCGGSICNDNPDSSFYHECE